ncbi:MAG: DUF4398 domain-containing protein [Calditrichaeota bacterium]|nr:DUF4398 domain-containing protein [Calditrichota bacterium]
MTLRTSPLLLGIITALLLLAVGCDTTADRELQRAEEALNAALRAGADASASEDYNKAEQLLVLAQEKAQLKEISEARRLAIESKILAEDALKKAEERERILEAESERIGKGR